LNQRIKLLDEHCINQIAAGEVVERPLSVVKELIENSIDAGSDKIEISVDGGGDTLIKVRDNGFGILPEDIRLAVLPHATSKINRIDDLDRLTTLGFRGEALPSIAAISRLSILSRASEEVSGYEIQIEGGKEVSFQETGCPVGTVVTVRDLFFNTPARQKFLRSANTEFGLISDMVSKLALARPDISFSLRHPNNHILNTPGRGNLLDTIATVLGGNIARKMLPISVDHGYFQLKGYIGSPELVRSSRSGITFLVNGRVIRSKLLNQSLRDGYHTLISSGTYPVAVLSLTMPPNSCDVNVHPAKLEIKFNNEKQISQMISDSIHRTLLQSAPLKKITIVSSNTFNPANSSNPANTFNTSNNSSGNSSYIQVKATRNLSNNNWQQLKLLYKPDSAGEKASNSYIHDANVADVADQIITDPNDTNHKNTDMEHKGIDFQEIRAVGQLFNTYILCTDDKSLFIIDQHAAHERIRYDELNTRIQDPNALSQMLLIPEAVELSAQEEQILLEHFENLNDLGFIIENFGERTYFLRAVPVLHNLENSGRLLRDFLDEILNKSFSPTRERLLEKWIYMMACRTAVKGNQKLSAQEMDELIQRLGNRENPFSCPHGRPTIITLSQKEMENLFNR